MKEFTKTIAITHGGIFHADDVFSTAFLKILNPEIVVNRVYAVPAVTESDESSIVYDIGFGPFDHHQDDSEVRKNGIPYAAFGLLWRAYGNLVLSKENQRKFDEIFIQPLDNSDNGGIIHSLYQAVSSFIPNWDENGNMDKAFEAAVEFALGILNREFKRLNSAEKAEQLITEALISSDGEIVVLESFAPWQEVLVPSSAKFVVFPSQRGGYNAQAIPTAVDGRDQKVPFPKEWVGADPGSILKGLTFVHPGRFLVATDTKEVAIAACKLAIKY